MRAPSIGIVHRDIKPENIALLHHESTEVFLVNFSNASSIRDRSPDARRTPSIYLKRQHSWPLGSPKHDVYALGAVLLSWYLGSIKMKQAGKSQKSFEETALCVTKALDTPPPLANIFKATILAGDTPCTAQDLANYAADFFMSEHK